MYVLVGLIASAVSGFIVEHKAKGMNLRFGDGPESESWDFLDSRSETEQAGKGHLTDLVKLS